MVIVATILYNFVTPHFFHTVPHPLPPLSMLQNYTFVILRGCFLKRSFSSFVLRSCFALKRCNIERGAGGSAHLLRVMVSYSIFLAATFFRVTNYAKSKWFTLFEWIWKGSHIRHCTVQITYIKMNIDLTTAYISANQENQLNCAKNTCVPFATRIRFWHHVRERKQHLCAVKRCMQNANLCS